jgi:class 3 adenylate cyclase/DNA-binding winged helix-turn-helix (wHTH) protein
MAATSKPEKDGSMDADRTLPAAYRFDRFTLNLARGALLVADRVELPLRPKSFALLQFLVENAGRLLDRDTIMQAVWPDVFVTDESITQCVCDIRRVLGDEAQRLLRTVPRRGYLFAADVWASAAQPAVPALPLVPLEDEPGRTRRDDLPEDLFKHSHPGGAPGWAPHFPIQRPVSKSDADGGSSRHSPSPQQMEPIGFSPSPGGERRQITVLSCDLVGATALSEELDPEDFGSVVRVYQELCGAAITRGGGHVASWMCDGVLAYFGYPQAYEDTAERAVRASLAIVEAASDLKSHPDLALRLRVGVATGLVVTEQMESAPGQVAIGKPLNLAARLQGIAEPGTVVIADSTRRLVGELFALEDLGSHALEGFRTPVPAWLVTGEGPTESRFEALRGVRFTPLVGRKQELALLLDRFEQAKEAEGQVVLLAGDPGIGKSRLIQALRDRLADEPHVDLCYYCSSHRRDSPLRPVIAHLERAAKFNRGDDPERKLAKLEALLALGNEDVARVAPLIASLLSIPSSGRYPPRDMSPQLQRERTLAALVDRLAASAAHQPVVLVWEDVHWADPTSLELLELVIDRLQSLPVLALLSFRSEFAPPWPDHTHITKLTLNRLSRRRCGRLVAGLTGGRSLPALVLDQIVARAEGVPLFVEELTKAVLESGLLREEGDRYELAGPLLPVAIPVTLRDSLLTRLDRLGPVEEIAQIGAVIGREFSHELLATVAGRSQDQMRLALEQLVASELVYCRGTPGEATYIFKHALVQDAAYDTLRRGERQRLHARIAEAIERGFPGVAESQPEVIARHLEEAGILRRAAEYWALAGERATRRSANVEAAMHLSRGLAIVAKLPENAERLGLELRLRMALCAALIVLKGPGAPETAAAFTAAKGLAEQSGDSSFLFPLLYNEFVVTTMRADYRSAQNVGERFLALAEAKNDPALMMIAQRLRRHQFRPRCSHRRSHEFGNVRFAL